MNCNKEKADIVLTLKEIEIININGEDLRRFIFESQISLQNDYVYTEKYGSERTIVEESIECFTVPGGEFPWLRCFIEGGIEYKSQKFLQLGGDDCYYSRPMSVDEYKKIDINFYPNPVTDFLYISGGTNILSEFNIEIISVDGKQVQSHKNFNSGNKIDLSSLGAGMYIIRLNDLNGINISNQKIIVLR